MTDVLFITPNMTRSVYGEPIGTLILATILMQNGFKVRIAPMCDFGDVNKDFQLFLNNALSAVEASGASVISFYTRCDTYHLVLRISEELKKKHPDLTIVYGGQQSDLCAEDTMNSFSFVDYICRGEGESTIVPFFRSLLEGTPDLSVKGLVYRRDDGTLSMNEKPEMLQSFDDIPMIDYQFFTDMGYSTNATVFPIDVGRGCPFSCTYCSTKSFWHRCYRLKEPDVIIKEMIHLHQTFGSSDFVFEHDMFTMNKAKVTAICSKIKELPFPVTWGCSARIDCLDYELIDTMFDSGMTSIFIGVETGSSRMQKLVNKNIKLSDVETIVSYLSKKGISTTVSFIYGFPQETEDDLELTMQMWLCLSAYKKVSVVGHLLTFLPGTELEEVYHDKLTASTKLSDITGDYAIAQCADIILNHPRVFPQYLEYRTALRDSTDLLPEFMEEYRLHRQIFEYLQKQYYQTIYSFYRAWRDNASFHSDGLKTKKNIRIMDSGEFIDSFSQDKCFAVISSLYRYETDKLIRERKQLLGLPIEYKDEVYDFYMQDYLCGRDVENIRHGISMLHFTKTPGLKVQESIRTSLI